MSWSVVPAGLVTILLSFNSFAEIDARVTLDAEKTAPKNLYPTAMLQRPFTLPTNSFETGLNFKVNTSQLAINGMHLDYGIIDDFQIGLSWNGVSANHNFSDLTPDKAISLNLGYFLFANHYAAAMLAFTQEFHLDNSRIAKSSSLAMPTSIPLIRGHLAFMTLHNDLIKMDWEKNVLEFNLPVKLNWQATDRLYLSVESRLGKLSTDGDHRHIFQEHDYWFQGLYAITPAIDIVARTGYNSAPDRGFAFITGINIRGGMLDG